MAWTSQLHEPEGNDEGSADALLQSEPETAPAAQAPGGRWRQHLRSRLPLAALAATAAACALLVLAQPRAPRLSPRVASLRSVEFAEKLVPRSGQCQKPLVPFEGSCICPPPWDFKFPGSLECVPPKGPKKMTFYVYRAQSNLVYELENVNVGSLAGVMYYMHNEIVSVDPRHNDVRRILRFKLTMQVTQEYYNRYHRQFMPFIAFGNGRQISPQVEKDIETYGMVVGCQGSGGQYGYRPFHSTRPLCALEPETHSCGPSSPGTWFSLPGPCPMTPNKDKTAACRAALPGGSCARVTGEKHCTYHLEPAGNVSLDELEGIESIDKFLYTWDENGKRKRTGNREWVRSLDKGIGMSFWDGHNDEARCAARMRAVLQLFKKHFPDLPEELPEPPCVL